MTTPLPPSGLGAVYSPTVACSSISHPPPQVKCAPIAHFTSLPCDGVGNDALRSSTPALRQGIPTSGRLLAVNSSYIAYAVKKGLVRVIDRKSADKTLLRGHSDNTRIVDAAFFGSEVIRDEGVGGLWDALSVARGGAASGGGLAPKPPSAASDVLATLGGMGDASGVIIWRIRTVNGALGADKLLQVQYPTGSRLIWHPYNPNFFFIMERNIEGASGNKAGVLVETTKLVTKRNSDNEQVCECAPDESNIPGLTPLASGEDALSGANDCTWASNDAKHILSGHDDGMVRLWNVSSPPEIACVASLPVADSDSTDDDKRVTSVRFLSQYEDSISDASKITPPFVVGTKMNFNVSLWSAFTASNPPRKLRVFGLQTDVPPALPNMLSIELCPAPYRPALNGNVTVPSSYVLLCEKSSGVMYALHLETEWKDGTSNTVVVNGFDAVTTLNVVNPVFSFSVAPSENAKSIKEEREVELCCVQSKAVQMLSLTSEMLLSQTGLPKQDEVAPGVTLIEAPAEVSDEEFEGEFDEDDYSMEEDDAVGSDANNDDDDGDDGGVQNPAPQESTGAFANWLGAIANPAAAVVPTQAKEDAPPGLGFPSVLPPPPGIENSAPQPDTSMPFLSPMQILNERKSEVAAPEAHPVSDAKPGSSAPQPSVLLSNIPQTGSDSNETDQNPSAQVPKKEKKKKQDMRKPSPVPNSNSSDVKILQKPEIAPVSSVDMGAIESTVERVIAKEMKSHQKALLTSLRKTVSSEVTAAVRTGLKDSERSTELAIQRALAVDGKFGKKLGGFAKESAALAAKEAVSQMQAPIMNALHQTMKDVMVPAYESATRQMFQQTSVSLEKGLNQIATSQENATNTTLEAMQIHLVKMTEAMAALQTEVVELRAAVANSASASTSVQAAPPPKPRDVRDEISSLCAADRFEEAFTKAVSASDGSVVLFTCKSCDIGTVFSPGGVSIGQPILICLLQQLGAVLVNTADPDDMKIVLQWLQEIAVTIDPNAPDIQRHVASVVQQLLANINAKMSSCDVAFRRPLQTLTQIIRGLL